MYDQIAKKLISKVSEKRKEYLIHRYLKLIQLFNGRECDFTHNHHILPSSIFPEHKKDRWNLSKVPPRVHFILHHILYKAIGGKMTFAYFQMCIHPKYNFKITSSQYGRLTAAFSKEMAGRVYCIDAEGNMRRLREEDVGDGVRLASKEEIWLHYRKFQLGKSNPAKRGKCAIYDNLTGRCFSGDVSMIDGDRYVANSSKRNKESRKKTSDAMRGRTMYHFPETKRTVMIKDGDPVPDGAVIGAVPQMDHYGRHVKGAVWVHSGDGDVIRAMPDNIPDGYTKGRGGYENNPFRGKNVVYDVRNGDVFMVDKGKPYPPFFHNKSGKYFYCIKSGDINCVTASPESLIKEFDLPFSVATLRNYEVTKKIRTKEWGQISLSELGISRTPVEEWEQFVGWDWC